MKTTKKRVKGAGTLYKKDSTYYAQWMLNGKLYRRSTQTANKREALDKLAEFTAPFRLSNESDTLDSITTRLQGVKAEIKKHEDGKPQLSIVSAWQAFLDSPSRTDASKATLQSYEFQYNRFIMFMRERFPEVKEIRHVTEAHAGEFSRELGKEYSPNRFNKYVNLLRRVWDIVGKQAKAPLNPWQDIKLKSLDTHRRRELTTEELISVCSSVSGEMRLLFAIGIYSGLRLGDAVTLKWSNIDLARRVILITPKKTERKSGGKVLQIPLHTVLRDMLLEVERTDAGGFVLVELSELYTRDARALTNKIKAVFEACGIQTNSAIEQRKRNAVDVGFHSLRHSFVSLAANAGTPLEIVRAIVGHSSQLMTRHYYHESAEAIESAINALPDVVNGGGMITVQPEPAAAEIAPGASVEDTAAAIRDRYTPAEIRALIRLLKPARG